MGFVNFSSCSAGSGVVGGRNPFSKPQTGQAGAEVAHLRLTCLSLAGTFLARRIPQFIHQLTLTT